MGRVMRLGLFIILMFAGLCVAHVIGRLIPHRPTRRETKQVQRVLAEDAYSSLLDLGSDEDIPNWTPQYQVWAMDEYRKMRKRGSA